MLADPACDAGNRILSCSTLGLVGTAGDYTCLGGLGGSGCHTNEFALPNQLYSPAFPKVLNLPIPFPLQQTACIKKDAVYAVAAAKNMAVQLAQLHPGQVFSILPAAPAGTATIFQESAANRCNDFAFASPVGSLGDVVFCPPCDDMEIQPLDLSQPGNPQVAGFLNNTKIQTEVLGSVNGPDAPCAMCPPAGQPAFPDSAVYPVDIPGAPATDYGPGPYTTYFRPIGMFNPPDHVFPNDHGAFSCMPNNTVIRAPTTGLISAVAATGSGQFRLHFHICKAYYWQLDHIGALAAKFQPTPSSSPRVATAGEIIGWTGVAAPTSNCASGSSGFDLQAIDRRDPAQPTSHHTNHAPDKPSFSFKPAPSAIYKEAGNVDSEYIVCPFAAYTDPAITSQSAIHSDGGEISSPDMCGRSAFDVDGTAAGAWVTPPQSGSTQAEIDNDQQAKYNGHDAAGNAVFLGPWPWNPAVAVVQIGNPSALASGGAASSAPVRFCFTPKTIGTAAYHNVAFDAVTYTNAATATYCFDSDSACPDTTASPSAIPTNHFLIQMTSSTSLAVEWSPGPCPGGAGFQMAAPHPLQR